MTRQRQDLTAIAKAVADMPRRDNSSYHQAMARAREAFAEAELALGGPVTMKAKVKMKAKTNAKSGRGAGKYVVKFVFTREE
jgi:hypothetical protein